MVRLGGKFRDLFFYKYLLVDVSGFKMDSRVGVIYIGVCFRGGGEIGYFLNRVGRVLVVFGWDVGNVFLGEEGLVIEG